MKNKATWIRNFILACLALGTSSVLAAAAPIPAPEREEAKQILNATGVRGGLIVHLGCGDGWLTAALGAGDRYLVHGLDRNSDNIQRARAHIRSLGRYGKVSVEKWTGEYLPYADNLVNLLVSEDLGDVSANEVLRVLAPRGVAYVKQSNGWIKTVKPWPKDMDEWTHWLHSPDGNAVARDKIVGHPRQLQWTAKPLWSRHHNTVPSVSAMVSSRGRLFTICDEAPPGLEGTLPDKWFLVARDAFNGVPLWKRPILEWGWRQWNTEWEGRFDMPLQLPKRLVADGDRLFATLSFNGRLTALDAATGEVLRVYDGTDNTDEILYQDGLLILSVNEEARTPSKNNKAPVKKSVCVIDADSGTMFWKQGVFTGLSAKYDSAQPFGRLEMTVGDGQVFLADHDAIVSLDLKSGAERWRTARPEFEEQLRMYFMRMSDECVMVYQDGVVLFAQPNMKKERSWHTLPGTLHAYDAKNGRELWQHGYGAWAHNGQPDVFVIDGLVWLAEHIDVEFPKHEPLNKAEIDYADIGLDLKTGELRRRLSTSKINNVDHHHRCYRGKATELFLLSSRRGVEFLDLATGENDLNHWARGGCLHGIVPCNGLLYLTPHPCKCYIETLLNGYNALAPESAPAPTPRSKNSDSARFEQGPAYSTAQNPKPKTQNANDWPTFRHDPLRSGSTAKSISEKLELFWHVRVGARISPPVVSGGKVFVASIDEHLVTALDAASGKTIWNFTAGGRVDTPPTIYNGLVLFGSADGWVYCLREADGQLAWRRRAALQEKKVGAYDQIESAWPVPGSILVEDNVAYLAAGRSTYFDQGICIYALNPATGEVIENRTLYSPDPETGDMLMPTVDRKVIPGALNDVLVSNGSSIYMRQEKIFGDASAGAAHLFSTAGFRDDAWFSRTTWAIGAVAKSQLMVFDDHMAYGLSVYENEKSSFQSVGKGYCLFSDEWKGPASRKPSVKAKNAKKLEGHWTVHIPVRVTAMALAGQTLLAAGSPDLIDPQDPLAALEGRKGGSLWIVSAANGKKLAECPLATPPVFDGMAVAGGRLYLAMQDGEVACLGDKQ